MAVFGGILQQLYGAKKLLIVSAIPSFISWILIATSPDSVPALLLSRFSAGIASGLLIGNIYVQNAASVHFFGPFKMIEVSVLSFQPL